MTQHIRSGLDDSGTPALPSWIEAMTGFKNSWRRCSTEHRLDPTAKPVVHRLTARELRDETAPLERYLPKINAELSFLQNVLRGEGYFSGFSNADGIIIEYNDGGIRNPSVDKRERAGAIWTESIAGTNGVGTCLAEARPVAVIRDEHFFEAFSDLTCFSAPVRSPQNDTLGVLNITSTARMFSVDALVVVAGLVLRTSERLGNDIFSEFYRDETILRFCEKDQILMLAVDRDHRVVGSNAPSRARFGLKDGEAISLWSLFCRNDAALRGIGDQERSVALRLRDRTDPTLVEMRGPHTPAAAQIALPAGRTVPPVADTRPSPEPAPARRESATTGREAVVPAAFGPLASDPARLRQLQRAATKGLPILLLGETGTGKDTMARAIHEDGDQAAGPFIAVNCGAIPEALIDSELFGYSAGAFTGARREGQSGRIQQADGGTLFLDEIGDMPLQLQARLLRFLETGEASPLGAGKVKRHSVRVIAATNHDLPERVAAGSFRQDLYFRLAGLVVDLPPLRERTDFDAVLSTFLISDEGATLSLTASAREKLAAHDWPGNLRELKFVLQRAACLCEDGSIDAEDVSFLRFVRDR